VVEGLPSMCAALVSIPSTKEKKRKEKKKRKKEKKISIQKCFISKGNFSLAYMF
jgi:hypothetical protein